mmetsp:Transcript_20958/g.34408  ORF Transcript_20958/g.34408 Transcript_20958/m.34408 type:complete len:206 (+) Transcript_20958:22-639(+)
MVAAWSYLLLSLVFSSTSALGPRIFPGLESREKDDWNSIQRSVFSSILPSSVTSFTPKNSSNKSSSKSKSKCSLLKNEDNVIYTMKVRVGCPPQEFDLVSDTGSDAIVIPEAGCKSCIKNNKTVYYPSKSNSSTTTQDQIVIQYGSGSIEGTAVSLLSAIDSYEHVYSFYLFMQHLFFVRRSMTLWKLLGSESCIKLLQHFRKNL